jgi:hypothetical protein
MSKFPETTPRHAFISYRRSDAPDVDQLVEALGPGYPILARY